MENSMYEEYSKIILDSEKWFRFNDRSFEEQLNIDTLFHSVNSNNFVLITGSNLTREKLIDIMLDLKCETGTNLDGGGSIALLYKRKNSSTVETVIGNNRSLTEVAYFSEQ